MQNYPDNYENETIFFLQKRNTIIFFSNDRDGGLVEYYITNSNRYMGKGNSKSPLLGMFLEWLQW